jgi:hypothetical protein
MSNQIIKEDVKKIFEECIKELMAQNSSPGLSDLVTSTIEFYENYKIENVDTSFPDEDMLLFEYGAYDWQDGKGENFTIGIARQYVVETLPWIKYSQLHLMLYYDKEDFTSIESLSKWSADFNKISDFKQFIITTEGFREAENKPFNSYDIFVVEGE